MQARWRFTDRTDGDLAPGSDHVEHRRRAVAAGAWTWVHQVHGADVVEVAKPGERAGATADALVTTVPGAVLAVAVADCAPVVLIGSRAGEACAVGVAHAGWRGLAAGIVDRSVTAMIDLGAAEVFALIGPCIGPECYEFGPADLDSVAAAVGPEVRSRTSDGRSALDLRAGVTTAVRASGAVVVGQPAPCTSCAAGAFWSHRARRDSERQAGVVWLDS